MGVLLGTVVLALSVVAGWRRLEHLARASLLFFGIEWTQVGAGDRLTALIGGVLGVIGLMLTAVGVWVALEQRAAARRDMDRKAVLKLVLPNPPMAKADSPTRYELFMLNDGDKTGTAYWYLGIPKRMRGRVSFEPRNGNEETLVAGDNWEIVGSFDQPGVPAFVDDYFLKKFVATVPLEPGAMMPCGTLVVQWISEDTEWLGQTSSELRDQAWRILGWFTNGQSGRFPEKGMLKLRLYAYTESWFKAQYGGKVLPEDDPDTFQ